jgi:hypothetical protein
LCNPYKGNFRKKISAHGNLSNIPVLIIRKYNLRYYYEKVKIKNKNIPERIALKSCISGLTFCLKPWSQDTKNTSLRREEIRDRRQKGRRIKEG